ncbi:cytochrome b5-related protein [Glossina fuscipes]|uniref:Cytochrome b5-related protein n=1 Tax=Glossina fuscipes TaxID=7396 RepID=A0A8U0WE96_9MUSC|nr:cytochrome b5-related protein [Glossina fuscipes]KAI9585947.1 hypothetical protein GQX74_001794 [Glossina fuscipes]
MVIEDWKNCCISKKFPSYRNSRVITAFGWLVSKREDDEAEGLWRIRDTLYDFTNFIDKHPGGSFWLKETKGTDITELFEAHHLSNMPASLIESYKVRDAINERIYTLTMHENGFYKTLKRRVRDKLPTIDVKRKSNSDNIHLALLLSTFLTVVFTARWNSLLLLVLAGTLLCWTVIAAHNYFHRRDNWRMYTFNLAMLNVCGWRISHAMSHHMYPNSYWDLELSMFEPFLCWIPNEHVKTLTLRYISFLIEPLVYAMTFLLDILTRIFYSIRCTNIMYWHDLLTFTIPLSMYLCSDLTLFMCLRQWLFIIMVASFAFCVIGLNAAHHDPKIYHEGDAIRDDRDWGLFQVDTIIDRVDLKSSQFLVLTHFGDHCLHHLFPTLDHGILPELYPIFYETLDEFKAQLREYNHFQHILGQHRQLLRVKSNLKPPGLM